MLIELTPLQARIIGCLLEKEIITPDQYPLSLSSLTNACNQKSSREPVLNLSETEVQNGLDELKKKHLISDRTGFGSRVAKYQHRFCNVGFGSLELTSQELAVVCVLLLRGAQTPGELRSRTNRLCEFEDVHETESVLEQLMQREEGPFVKRLGREPGKRESRYAHLFCGEVSSMESQEHEETGESTQRSDEGRLAQLEEEVESLRHELDGIKARLDLLTENE
ncbi:MAG: DUF480 domain-containing protein [Candidatus Thiodiazotropha weberae]|uniref:Uncharacterized protein n=1 Tax=Candidatus Thiodiazotropha endoloripes TaxID=1818881 RepID=A0A1E2UR44_9GAMM|nr:DUF480 domain-containing protein [Candidatus Thiodiazotropha endoloripes]MCG7896837.1 DUF480 domain-containing protein [Candidatus Thiodiazotropha weberae]MCG7904061.1 DUF480 domain-containing protein [Candidatus Thiodiazotropha weberae]MCG7914315.1 DUF480 domain-containing protein [Candidatus Thiodiazotropha weberae]ODB86086.1 hypothetical protein A3195_10555 [Candidatus Thiodiazotropha endoloripes]ODB88119.1 hypothetical protein A3193_04360 [Candidatus Thiodiazotropha endoloripes]